jgi:hypothetical protein
MKRYLIFLLFASALSAQIGLEYNLDIHSNFIYRDWDYGELAAPELLVSFGEEGNAWIDFWGAVSPDFLELDISAGYGIELSEKLTIEPGILYYWVDFDFAQSTTEFFLNFYSSFLKNPMMVWLGYDIDLKTIYVDHTFTFEKEFESFSAFIEPGFGLVSHSEFSGFNYLKLKSGAGFSAGPLWLSPSYELYVATSDDNRLMHNFALSLSLGE